MCFIQDNFVTDDMPPAPVETGNNAQQDDDTCESVCYQPECACRTRKIAGCSLPLAPVLIIGAVRKYRIETSGKRKK